jgi:DnaK suppressor protein
MSTRVMARKTTARVTSTPPRNVTSSVPPPHHLTTTQMRELESELRRELAALERRLVNERVDDSAETSGFATTDAAAANRRTSDTLVRRDSVAEALARLSSDSYGACSRCGDPIPYGRLLVMPEATHCLGCGGRF